MEMTKEIFFVVWDEGAEVGMFFFQQEYGIDPSTTAARFIHAHERGSGFEIGGLDYDIYFLTDLVSPIIINKDKLFDLWAYASTAITNNPDLARIVAELAGLRCGKIELDVD